MAKQNNSQSEQSKDIDVSRSENQQAQKAANARDDEERSEGSKYKGNPPHHHGSHGEGEYTKQSDDPTMHPSDLDEK